MKAEVKKDLSERMTNILLTQSYESMSEYRISVVINAIKAGLQKITTENAQHSIDHCLKLHSKALNLERFEF